MKDAPFQAVDSSRISERVAESIIQAIIGGKLEAGKNLPPERQLAQMFNVTRNTVREALRQVENSGLVSVRHGSGITVNDYNHEAGVEVIRFLKGKAYEIEMRRDVAVFRMVVGQAMVFHAIDVMGPDALGPLREAVDAFCEEAEKQEPNVPRLQELDFVIHRRMIQASKNKTMLFVHNTIRHNYYQTLELYKALVMDPLLIARYYRRTMDALKAGNRAGAKRTMRKYFQYGYSVLIET